MEWLVGQPLPCLNRHPTAAEGSFCAFLRLPANLAILAFLQYIKNYNYILKIITINLTIGTNIKI